MGNVSSITQYIGVTKRKALKDDIQRLVDINIEFRNELENEEVVMYNVNEAFTEINHS